MLVDKLKNQFKKAFSKTNLTPAAFGRICQGDIPINSSSVLSIIH